MTVPGVLSLPWSIYSRYTITATSSTLLTPTITSSSPSYLWKETKTLLHTSVEVSNSDCPLWSHTSPEQSIFTLPAVGLFSASVSASPGCLLLTSMPWWKCSKMAVGGGSGDLRTENGILELEGWKAGQWVCCNLYMHLCDQYAEALDELLATKYSDSVSSCCGLKSSSTIDLVSWREGRGNRRSWSPYCGL